jgi:CBS domain-containing protein
MKGDVWCATVQTTVTQAAELMRDEQIGFVPVCDKGRNVIGILTDRDIATRVVAEGHSPSEPVERFMSPRVVACRSDEDLRFAQDLMGEKKISRIICVSENGQVEGIISLSDIAQIENGADVANTLRSIALRESRA